MKLAVEAHGLSKSYGALRAVDGLELEVPAGMVLGFLGPNGAGKTTVIRMLTTILVPTAGTFFVAGVPNTRPEEIRGRIGVLPESAGYPDRQTGLGFLRYHARLFGLSRGSARERAASLLDEVGLGERGGSLVGGYSRGMRQRLGIARALVNDPDVVFLDEPTLGLDPAGQRQMLELVRSISSERGATVLLSTHLLAEVEEVCSSVVILNQGKVVADGTVADVARRAAAPRRARIRIPPDVSRQALATLSNGGGFRATELRPGELEVTWPGDADPESMSTEALRRLVEAHVPVVGYELEGGRLSDAFLAMTGASE
jgi:ABC-2 type transport system ATP-binding protein